MTGGFNLTERIQTVTKKLADVNAEMAWEAAGTAADVAGMVDPTPISDAVGAGIAIRNGDFLGAGLNVVGMIPYLGDAVAKPIKATRVAKRVLALKEKATLLTKELADLNALKKKEEAAELAAKEAKVAADAKKAKDAEKAAAEQEKAAAKAKDKDCEDCAKAGKPLKEMKQVEVKPCFAPGKKLGASRAEEFRQQLERQEAALNRMTVKEYEDARAFFKVNKRKGTGANQQRARKEYETVLTNDLFTDFRKTNSYGAAMKKAKEAAALKMKDIAALHEPDMIAGGIDAVANMGDRRVNSSIGSQWKNRVGEIDNAAKDIPDIDKANTKMNVKLPHC